MAVDVLARLVFNITSTGVSGIITAIWLCTLLVLRAGAALGRLLVRMLPWYINGAKRCQSTFPAESMTQLSRGRITRVGQFSPNSYS